MKTIVIAGIFFVVLLLIFSAGLAVSISGKIPKKTTPNHVEVKSEKLYVNDKEFFVKGVTYSPVPVGEDPRQKSYNDWLSQPDIYKRDFAEMKRMGVNTIRVLNLSGGTTEVRLFLDAANDYNIKVIMGYVGPIKDDTSEPQIRDREKKIAHDMVNNYKDHPAILMWMMGNEVNYWYPKDKNVHDWYTLLEEISLDSKTIDPNHPIVTANNALTNLDDFSRTDKSVDIYGTNQYGVSNASWKYMYEGYRNSRSRRPILITEFGADSWDSRSEIEDENMQSKIIMGDWNSIKNEKSSIGGVVFEWSDEWWKSGLPLKRNCQKDWQPFDKESLPDQWFSEECFGITKQQTGTYDKLPKQVYLELQKAWSDPKEDSNPTISYVNIDTSGHVESGLATYGDVGANVTLYYKTTFGSWTEVPMQREDWRYTAQIPKIYGILSYRVTATDIYQRSGEKDGKLFMF